MSIWIACKAMASPGQICCVDQLSELGDFPLQNTRVSTTYADKSGVVE